MMLMIFSHLMTMPMKLSSSGILILFMCLSHECTGRHLSSIDSLAMDDNAMRLSHPTIKGFENDLLTVPDHLNLKMTENGKDQSSKVDNDHRKKTDSKSQSKKDVNNDQKLKKVKEEQVHHHHQHQPKSHNLKMTENGKDQSSKVDNDDHKKTDSKSQNKKDVNKDQKLKKVQEEEVHHHQHQHQPKSHTSVTFRVPPRNKRIHQQPGFNLDYSPPKTHPPSHN
ncbi:uncharacterized protein LOC111921377 [Lactuca sativa]|uniref:Uncharacterized protein n=1 Tax=Lactuca sativa TaxID=4236 RepID=A0A9R1XFA8_LACSA|nr:uncharacterized protein LOC111921377 [Lactuca sativa]KAJ0210756.1 hypothetical protein LSAT_V11C400193780 [Lactuca sativa]